MGGYRSNMAAAAILNFGKMSITPDWIKILCDVIKWTSVWSVTVHVDLSGYNRYLKWEPNLVELKHQTIWLIRNVENSHNEKIEVDGDRHLEFLKKMSITSVCIQIFAPSLVWRCAIAMQRCPHDQKLKPEVNLRDVIKWMLGPKGRRSQRL